MSFMKKMLGLAMSLVTVVMLSVVISLTSCNVTRVISHESSYFQRGDTTVTITVKTIESYDGTKK